jgi:hypothetical protein
MVHSLDVMAIVQFNIGLLLRFFLEFHRSWLLILKFLKCVKNAI